MAETPLWALWYYKPSILREAHSPEFSESQGGVLLPVSVCASGHLKSLFVNKYIQWWKENKSSYIFFHVIMGPMRSNTKILLSL